MKHLRRRNFAARTVETYADCLSVFHRWLIEHNHASPLQVTPADLDRFMVYLANDHAHRGKPVGVGRRGVYVAVLRSVYRFAVQERRMLSDPAASLQAPKLPRRLHRDVLTADALRRLLNKPGDAPPGLRDQVALRLLALSGLRASEAIHLDLDDLNLPARELVIRGGKGDKDRLTFIDTTTQRIVARYLVQARPMLAESNEPALLVSNTGRQLAVVQLRAIVQRYAKAIRLGRSIHCHSLRRTFCTLMLASGVSGMNLKVIGELAGHARLKTTARYAKVDLQDLTRIYHQAHPLAGHALEGGDA